MKQAKDIFEELQLSLDEESNIATYLIEDAAKDVMARVYAACRNRVSKAEMVNVLREQILGDANREALRKKIEDKLLRRLVPLKVTKMEVSAYTKLTK